MKEAVKSWTPVSMDTLVHQTESPFTTEVLHFPLPGIRPNEGPNRPPQHLQEPDGVTWIPRPSAMSSLRNHIEGPNINLVQQTSAILDLVLQRALHRFRLPLHWSSDIQEAELSPANHQAAATREPGVLRPKVQRIVFKGGRPRREVRHHRFHRWTRSTIKGPDVFHLKESIGDHDRGACQSREVYQWRGSPYIKTGKLFYTQGKKKRRQKKAQQPRSQATQFSELNCSKRHNSLGAKQLSFQSLTAQKGTIAQEPQQLSLREPKQLGRQNNLEGTTAQEPSSSVFRA